MSKELREHIKDCHNTNTIFDNRQYVLLKDAEEILESKLKEAEEKNKELMGEINSHSDLGDVSGSYIWLVEDCDGSCILSAHLTEEAAKKEREKLRSWHALRVDFRVYSVQIS